MGAWVAFEFLCYARSMGLPMPCKVFISAMPYPAIPFKQRPWKQQATLNEREFQVTRHCCMLKRTVQACAIRPAMPNNLMFVICTYCMQGIIVQPVLVPTHLYYYIITLS